MRHVQAPGQRLFDESLTDRILEAAALELQLQVQLLAL
jgi:hypothetical protein